MTFTHFRKTIALIIIATSQLPAKEVWLHSASWVGSANKGIDPAEFWDELQITNTGRHAETVTVVARRYDGHQILNESYRIGPKEKRTIRVEDRDTNINEAGKFTIPKPMSEAEKRFRPPISEAEKHFRAILGITILIDPVPSNLWIELRQMTLYGDQLTTTVLANDDYVIQPQTRLYYRLEAGDHEFHLTNIGSKPGTVLYCKGMQPMLGCYMRTKEIDVPAHSDVTLNLRTVSECLFFTKPKEIIVGGYNLIDGTTSTFHVNSGITFGPVK
jgi:hypothetical protein